MDKKKIIDAFIAEVEREIETLTASANAAHEAATHEESKAEDSHDTRGIEASYLAGAQAARAAELKQVVLEYRLLRDSAEAGTKTIAAGVIVGVQPLVSEDDPRPKGARLHALFAVRGGGTSVEVDGTSYSVFTPASPIGDAILGASAGEVVTIESKGGDRAYRVESIE